MLVIRSSLYHWIYCEICQLIPSINPSNAFPMLFIFNFIFGLCVGRLHRQCCTTNDDGINYTLLSVYLTYVEKKQKKHAHNIINDSWISIRYAFNSTVHMGERKNGYVVWEQDRYKRFNLFYYFYSLLFSNGSSDRVYRMIFVVQILDSEIRIRIQMNNYYYYRAIASTIEFT